MKKVVLFGAGQMGQEVMRQCSDISEKLLFCDNDIKKSGTRINNIEIVDFNKLLYLYKQGEISKVIITTSYLTSILHQCVVNEIDIDDIYFFDREKKSFKHICEFYASSIYSQDGEEMYLKEKYHNKTNGIYVDVGANHPFMFSNTYWAYLKGWKGINIEPDICNYELLKNIKKKDININCGISDNESVLHYYEFQEDALNTFCENEVNNKDEVINIRNVPVKRLDSIFDQYEIKEINFIDIDVEGMEMNVLKSIDWDKVSIECILIEQRGLTLLGVVKSEVCKFLIGKGYAPISKFDRTVIYEKQ